jgi:hypothetical protein
MMSSPFPHVHAKAAQDKLAAKSAKTKKSEAWELLWTGCWRALLVTICTIAAVFVYKLAIGNREGRLFVNWLADHSTLVRSDDAAAPSADEFFIEIGHSSEDLLRSAGGKMLERKGWNGVCAVPLNGDLPGRKCRVVSLPVASQDGHTVSVPDCSRLSSFQSLLRMFTEVHCPTVEATTVSVAKLLQIASAPKVIDFISLESQQSDLGIVSHFPFSEYCVRAWAFKNIGEEKAAAGIRHQLEVGQGCHIRSDSTSHLWARCPCEKLHKRQHKSGAAGQKANATQMIEIEASGQSNKRKGRKGAPSPSSLVRS